MVDSKSYPWVDQVLELELNPCESCGAWYSHLLEKHASTGEYVRGGEFEIKSLIRGNIVLRHEDVCHSCLILAKMAITLRPSLHTQGLSDFKDLMVCFDLVNISEGIVNTTVSWYRGGGSNLLFRQAITISELDHISPSVSISVAKESRSSAKSKQNIGFIRTMLSLCETGHGCHRDCTPGGDRRLPARLVSIGDSHSPTRLYETGKDEQGSYAALSHCWGPLEKRPIRTLQGNIDSMKSEIPWGSLSAVFKDSIWLCRQLGIKYIWIDSLCIVQDDGSDWEVEAAKMAQYYSEARVTIAVDSSPDGTAPFLSQRNERWQPQTSSSMPYLIAREHYGRQLQEAHPIFYCPAARHLLLTRAWAMQESILSTRVIHFTPSDVTWECDGETVSEDGFRVWDKVTTHEPSRPFFDIANTSQGDDEQRTAIWELWMGVIAEFTDRSITYTTDRLPALSGMASRFQEIVGGRYLAGIWEAYLIEGLSWTRRRLDKGNIRAPSSKLAPTWSWVSMSEKARVEFHHDRGISDLPSRLCPKILEVYCESSKDAPFGRVEAGHMLIKTPLFKATLVYNTRSSHQHIKYAVIAREDEGNREPWTSGDFDVDCLLSVKDGNALRAFDDDELEYLSDPPSFTATAWIMWLGYGGLVIGNDPDSKDFQRLGYLDASKPGSSGHMSPVDDLEGWVDSLKWTVMQFRLV